MFLTQTQINKLREKVENHMSTDIKLSKSQINKLLKEEGALGSILARFLQKVIKPALSLGKNILAPLGLSAAMSATDAVIQKKMYGIGRKTVEFSNKDLDDMTKIVKALEDSDVLMKGMTKTLSASLLTGRGLFRAGKGMCRSGNRGQGI